jgi:hypothetical protein
MIAQVLAGTFAILLIVGAVFALLAGLDKIARGKFYKWRNRRQCARSMAYFKNPTGEAR